MDDSAFMELISTLEGSLSQTAPRRPAAPVVVQGSLKMTSIGKANNQWSYQKTLLLKMHHALLEVADIQDDKERALQRAIISSRMMDRDMVNAITELDLRCKAFGVPKSTPIHEKLRWLDQMEQGMAINVSGPLNGNQSIKGNNNIQAGGDVNIEMKNRTITITDAEEPKGEALLGNDRPKIQTNVKVHARNMWKAYRDNDVDRVYELVQKRCDVGEIECAAAKTVLAMILVWMLLFVAALVVGFGAVVVLLGGLVVVVGACIWMSDNHAWPTTRTRQAKYEQRLLEEILILQRNHDHFVDAVGGELTKVEKDGRD